MFRSKIFIKAFLAVAFIFISYTSIILLVAVPKINKDFLSLEEKRAKEILDNAVKEVNNIIKDIQDYKIEALNKSKDKVVSVTDAVLSIIDDKYKQTLNNKIEDTLEKRVKNFKKNLITFYKKNKNIMSEEELKKSIINYVNLYRARDGIGYFWINDFEPKMVIHPIIKSLNGKYLGDYKDKDGKYLFNKMVEVCKKDNQGFIKYKWLNPKTKKIEDKISFITVFEPFNWIIGTGEYISVLQNRLKNEIKEVVKNIRYGKNNYFCILNTDYKMVMYPLKSEFNGKNLINLKDIKGKLFFKEMVEVCKTKGNGFVQYYWLNPVTNKQEQKLTFVKLFPKWNWIIGTGVYISDIDKDIKYKKNILIKRLKNYLKSITIGKSGYIFIFNSKKEFISHPYLTNENKNKFIKQIANNHILDDFIKASKENKSLHYKWSHPSDKNNFIYEKIAWVKYIPELDWYVCASVYTDELKESSNKTQQFIYFLVIFMLIILLIISFYFFRYFLDPIRELSYLSIKVANGNYSVKTTIDRDDEIGVLAKHFNNMIKTIKTTLDKFIKNEKELKELNKTLEKKIKDAVLKNLKQQKQIYETQKLAQMGEMIGNIAHQWRQPLSAISSGATGMLVQKEYGLLTDKIFIDTCETINKNAQYLSRTIDDFRNFIKGDRKKTKFFIYKTFEQMIELLKGNIKNNNINIVQNIPQNIEVSGYENELIQCFINIINNAKDVFKEKDIKNRYIFIDSYIKDDNLIIIIKDNGGGIPEDILPKIFDPYFTTKHKSQGTGLGLHMTYKMITEGMNGKIEAVNENYEYNQEHYIGAKFIITLPLSDD